MTRRSRKTRTTYGVRALRSERGYAVQSLASRRLLELPLVRQPSIQFAQLRLRQVLVKLARIANVRPPRGLPTKREFFRFNTTRFISRSLTLLSMGTAPSEQKMFSSAQ